MDINRRTGLFTYASSFFKPGLFVNRLEIERERNREREKEREREFKKKKKNI